MAGNIQGLNLAKLKEVEKNYQSVALKVNERLVTINLDIEDLTKNWTGKNVNSVVNVWNNSVASIEQYASFTRKVYDNLFSIEQQYSKMETGKAGDVNSDQAMKHWGECTKVKLTDETTIKYNKSGVEPTIKDIENMVKQNESDLKKLLTILDNIQTYSDSLKSLVQNYKATIGTVQSGLVKICNLVMQEAKNAANTVNTTEAYNETDAKKIRK